MNSSEHSMTAAPAGTSGRERRGWIAERRAVGSARALSDVVAGRAHASFTAVAPSSRLQLPKPASSVPARVSSQPSKGPLPPDDEMWEVGHVARFLKRSESWVYKKTALGVLPVHRLDGWGLRYVPAEIRGWAGEANKKKHR
jgi:hypothetical protein